jgi:A118 family predicted phage portal protein
MNQFVINYLNKKYGYEIVKDTEIYDKIDLWKSYYKNESSLHKYIDNYGKTRYSYSLGMAKRISEDWASIGFTEKDEISVNKNNNKKFIKDFIEEIKLYNEIPEAIETSTWSGTCGAIIRLKNIVVKNKKIEATDKTSYDLIKVSGRNILPLRIEHGKIIDVAFISGIKKDNKKIIYIELHRLTDNGYVINNIYLDAKSGKEVRYDDIIPEMETETDTPLFAILKTPIINTIDDNLGLGMSMYGNAIDQIEDCDIKYHNSVMDFVLGGKKIIYNKKLVKYKQVNITKEDGTKEVKEIPVYPDDISKQQFMEIGDALSKDNLIHEYNPTLRTTENKEGLQFSLDLLSFKAGLGTKYYEFSGGSVVTATQYSGDRQDLMKNAKKYRDNINEFIGDILKAGLLLARLVLKKNVTEDCIVSVTNRDGLLITDEEIKEQYRQEYNMGLISKITYLMKINNWTEDEAKEELARIEAENSIEEVSEE